MESDGSIAVIARTNGQIANISRELEKENIPFSSTHHTASNEARESIINYLRGMLSNDPEDAKNALLTPFAPVSLPDAFDILDGDKLTQETLIEKAPAFMAQKEKLGSVEDVDRLFVEEIIPVAFSYGMEYVQAAQNLRDAFREALQFVGDVRLENLLAYLRTADLSTNEIKTKSRVTLTTVHKAKGKEYDTIIYTPTKPPNSSNYQDEFVETVLYTEGIDAREELEEEVLRINFVAFTRAKKKLAVVGENISELLNGRSVEGELAVSGSTETDFAESQKKAFAFFVSGEYERAKELLAKKESWLTDYVKNFFGSLRHISFSSANGKAYDYLVDTVLGLREQTVSLARGLSVHTVAEELIRKGECECPEGLAQYRDNISSLLSAIREKYPEIEAAEHIFRIPLNKLIETDEELLFTGKIDAVFRNGDSYLIVDWKTDKTQENASHHRQQLEAYKRAFCSANSLDPDKVKVSLAFIGLKPKMNMGTIGCELDEKQPAKTSFDTFARRVQNVLRWKKDPDSFFHEILETEVNDPLWRSVVEQYMRERS